MKRLCKVTLDNNRVITSSLSKESQARVLTADNVVSVVPMTIRECTAHWWNHMVSVCKR